MFPRTLCNCLLLAGLLAGPAWGGRAGDYLVKTWEVDDGLPESGVSEVAQSAEGYIWVGTLNSGLTRFDGVHFVNFDSANTPQLAGRGVRRLLTDRDGVLWINGFGNYLASWQGGVFRMEYPGPAVITSLVGTGRGKILFATQEGQLLEGTGGPEGRTWRKLAPTGTGANERFFADGQGGVWYRRVDRQLVRLADGEEQLLAPEPDYAMTSALAGDGQGNLVVGTTNHLWGWVNGRFENLTPTNGEANLWVQGLVADGQGGWWVWGNNRLRRCSRRRWTAEAGDWLGQGRIWGKVHHEQPDGQGGVWLNYLDAGLIHVDAAGKLNTVTTADGLPSNSVRALFQDREDNLWVSFESGGLARVRPRRFDAVGKNEGLADTVVTSVCEDRAGAIWIGTISGTVSRYAGGECTNFTLPLLGTHCEKAIVYPDGEGRVWVGTQGNGVFVEEHDDFQQMLTPKEVGMRVRSVLVGQDGRVWVASQDGLFCLAAGALHRVLAPAFEEDYPTALAAGPGGTVWIGMNTGSLYEANGEVLKRFRPAAAGERRRFSAVFPDDSGNVWIGTLGEGLLRFKAGEFQAVTAAQGLPGDTLSQVLEDPAGNLWFGSRAGVFSAKRDALIDCAVGRARTVLCRMYGRDDGLPTLGCAGEFQPTAWRGHDARLWFATGKGVTGALPHDPEVNGEPPPVIIEDVRVDGKTQWQEPTPANPLAAGAVPVRRLDISPGRHQLEFRYTGLSFKAPDRVRFKYRLDGLDRQWTEVTANRGVIYSSVPAGRYCFRVLARNSDGVWSAAEATLPLTIRLHAWETWWFRGAALAGLLAAVGGSGWGYERRRTRRRLEAIERQQAIERERVRVARDLHDDLGAGLTEIGLLGALARRTTTAPERVQEHLGHITDKAREMVTSLDEIVWSINPKNDSLVSLSKYFCEYAQQLLQLTPIRCRLEVADELADGPLTSEQRHHLLMAFKEALTNVIRHAEAAEVRIGIAVTDGELVIMVADDGRGFAGSPAPAGADGLVNLARRLDQLEGRCEVLSEPGGGTTVRLILPLPPKGAA